MDGKANRDRRITTHAGAEIDSTHSVITNGLAALQWRAIGRVPGLYATDGQLLHRIKAGGLSFWNQRDNTTRCP